MKALLTLLCVIAYNAENCNNSAVIDRSLHNKYLLGGRETTNNVVVSFTQSIYKVIDQINFKRFSSISEKRIALTKAQQFFTKRSQKPLQDFLESLNVPYESFWINNRMYIPNTKYDLVKAISNISNVYKIEEEPKPFKLEYVSNLEAQVTANDSNEWRQFRGVTWGVWKIGADRVWSSYTGRGVVVAGIDTGVRYTHEALRNNWRKNYGWFDPYYGTTLPSDEEGHGTHVIGTIAGTGGIGVAPGATWISCKGCFRRNCYPRSILACAQWVQCPTNPDGTLQNCDMAPQIVSNSWAEPDHEGKNAYNEVIRSWRSAGIIPVFSVGNGGPKCKTLSYPGSNEFVFGVGGTDVNDKIYERSGRGPTLDGRTMPDIVAPGVQVYSATSGSDNEYMTFTGNSMSCPHVSGVIALMLEKNRNLINKRSGFNEIYKAIANTAVREGLDSSTANTCGGVGPGRFPNPVFGHGRINAYKAVRAI